MESDTDYYGRYRSISNKLKKRFLKKPNLAEGSEQFSYLAKTFKHQECPQYSACCCLAQARCEQALANPAGEAQALSEAARDFMEAELRNKELRCPSFQEHFTAAISCYGHAVRVHIDNKQPALASSLCLQLGDFLIKLDKPGEALCHYLHAAQLQTRNPLECLHAMGHVVTCKLYIGDNEGALSVLTEMAFIAQENGGDTTCGKPAGAYVDVLTRCEVTRVLLLMLLRPSPQKMLTEHGKTLEKYAWESSDDGKPDFLSENMFLLLQSLVMACQSKDMKSLKLLQVDLWPTLSAEQNQLLHQVILTLANTSQDAI